MRRLVLLWMLGAGCANAEFQPDAGIPSDARVDAEQVDAEPDAAVGPGFFLDDSAADFAGGTQDGTVVEAFGAIAPAAYYTGGLLVRASDTATFADAATETWAQVMAMPLTPAMAPARTLTRDWGSGVPAGLALTGGDDLTMVYTGEVYLEAGMWTFYVLADDHAFLELAPIGSTTFTRVVSANWPNEASGTFMAPASGWYPIHLAHAEQSGAIQLAVQATGPTVAMKAPLSRQRLRFLASGLEGMAVAGFDDGRLLGDEGTSIDHTAPAGVNWNDGRPADLGITAADDFSVRWAGQLLVDTGGPYTFRYVSDDGQRLWVDGALVLDHWDETPHDSMTAPIDLSPGWHDLAVDVNESAGSAQAFLGVVNGPDLVAATLPPARLRPVETRGERYETAVDHTARAIPDAGMVEAPLVIDAPPGAKAGSVEVGWTFDHTYWGDLEISLVAPDGSVVLLRDNAGGDGSGTVSERLHTDAFADATASGTWKLRVRDTVSVDTGTLRAFELTVHTHAGAPPIPAHATFESAVKDLGPGVRSYAKFSWSARREPGAAVRLYARSGDSVVECREADWSSAMVDAEGGVPAVTPRRYFQYLVELDGDGDRSATVDWVRLDLTAEVP
ncbi:MAG TPA: proprotein convertase P-domain-containing protein [Kofleriaceae bacterium]|nr:proprotein convertase P-domain-containing protein [Kofleriaceae bacterium]